jgi:hypothetical protein
VGIPIGLVCGALAIVGTFLPWASTTEPAARSFTGWEIYQEQQAIHEDAFFISRFWSGAPSPLFTGAVTLALGIAIVVLTTIVLAAPRRVVAARQRPAMMMLVPRVPAIVVFLSFATTFAAMIVTAVNVVGISDREVSLATAEPGFWVTLAGLLLGGTGLLVALSWVPKRRRIEAPPMSA